VVAIVENNKIKKCTRDGASEHSNSRFEAAAAAAAVVI